MIHRSWRCNTLQISSGNNTDRSPTSSFFKLGWSTLPPVPIAASIALSPLSQPVFSATCHDWIPFGVTRKPITDRSKTPNITTASFGCIDLRSVGSSSLVGNEAGIARGPAEAAQSNDSWVVLNRSNASQRLLSSSFQRRASHCGDLSNGSIHSRIRLAF